MRISAATVVLAILLFGFQLGFSERTMPRLAALPIGIGPVTAGAILLAVGLVLGIISGDRQYRTATALAIVGTALILDALFTITSGGLGRQQPAVTENELVLTLGSLLWLAALVLGAQALRVSAARR